MKAPLAAATSMVAVARGSISSANTRNRGQVVENVPTVHLSANRVRLVEVNCDARAPRNAMLHGWRGLLLHAERRYDDELLELRRAVSIDDRSWQASLHLGLGYSRRGQYALALAALRRAVVLSDGGLVAAGS